MGFIVPLFLWLFFFGGTICESDETTTDVDDESEDDNKTIAV